jgi:hypothetical protein
MESKEYAMVSNRGDGIRLFVARGSHSQAVDAIHKRYAEEIGVDGSRAPRTNPNNVKVLDEMDFSFYGGMPQKIIICRV